MELPRGEAGSVGGIARKRPESTPRTEADAGRLRQVLGMIAEADGLSVRCEGKTLVLSRKEALGPRGRLEDDDRIKLTYLGGGAYGIWVSLSGGEYEFTDLGGSIEDLRAHLEGPLLHVIRAWTTPKPKKRRGTSGT